MAEQPTGFQGIWYYNQAQNNAYHYKYSGGLGTYPQQHVPLAIYAPVAHKTFFCYGGRGAEAHQILDMVAEYDHRRGLVSRPRLVLQRQTFDAHYNPTLGLDEAGHVYVFCNSHGPGYELKEKDPTHGRSYIYRSREPYRLDTLEPVRDDNFSYSQPWAVPGQGLLWLHTRYLDGQRRLFWASSRDGLNWSEPQMLAHIERGNYQISWRHGQRIGTAFDFHPTENGLNARSNIYYLQSDDLGQTWRTANGDVVRPPLTTVDNPALGHNYRREGKLVYLKDLAFDSEGRPVILYLTSHGPWSGPDSGPREWFTTRWTGTDWDTQPFTTSDHNYDHGSLYIEPGDGSETWRVIAPTDPGPQAYGTGGQIAVHLSRDQGRTWQKVATVALAAPRNQTYVRKPVDAHPDFYALWADGDAFAPSDSHLYFAAQDGSVYRLPPDMDSDEAPPERLTLR